MDDYKHYIRTNEAGIVIHGFSDAFEKPLEDDVELLGEHGRHFQLQLMSTRGQYVYRIDGVDLIERSQEELEDEWAARPAAPPTETERIQQLEQEKAVLEQRLQATEGAILFLMDMV